MNKSKIKSIISLVLVLLLCISVSACSNDSTYEDDYSQSESSETYDTSSEDDYEPSYEEPTTSVTDLGFYNLDELTDEYGNCIWVGIDGYDASEGYVWCDRNTPGLLFKGGFIQKIQRVHDHYPSYDIGRGPYAYTTASNDGIAASGEGSVLINERININDKAVIFKCQTIFETSREEWFIPASMIDWSTRDDNFTYGDYTAYTRYYVK